MDRFDAMSVTLAVVEAGSLSAASRRLGMPLATVSRRISELEARLKTRLLNRSSRQMTLTDSGRLYVEACRRILEDVEQAERAAAGEYRAPKGLLTITAPVVLGRVHVLPVALEFLEAHPKIDLRLVLTDSLLSLLEHNIDLAVRIGVLPDSNLIATRIGAIRRVVCASPAYLAARGRPNRPADVSGHDCITFENLASSGSWIFRSANRERAVAVHSRLSVTTAEAAIDAAIAGLGMTRVLSYMIEDMVQAGLLEIVLETFEPAPWPVNLVYAEKGLVPLKLRTFLDWATPRFKARLA
jgi:DNA-binding transcriptional LysR family regulator